MNEDRLFMMENPDKSRIWTEEAVQRLARLCGVTTVLCDGGVFGATDRDNCPIIKTYKFMVNDTELAQALHRRLSPQERQVCRPLEGVHVTNSQVYPDELVRTILKVLKKKAQRWSRQRFDEAPVEDHDRWRRILNDVRNMFSGGTVKSLNIQPGQEICERVKELVPWELTRVQVGSLPITRRMPQDVPYTHRGSALLHNDECITLESEDLALLRFPRMRFQKAVAAAVFFYGVAEDDEKHPAAAAADHHQDNAEDQNINVPVPGLRTDITFPDAPKTLPAAVKASVARLHLNMGHASKQELTRLLAAHGSINGMVLTALEKMVCGSCQRTKRPAAPRPATVPNFMGQFGERVQLDIVYIRDLSGCNHPVLEMVDLATTFQQAVRLLSCSSEHVLDCFRRAWLSPYGYPLVCEVDADGAFEGSFRSTLEENGVHVPTIPPEAHWRIGTVERRNALLRTVVEKLVDENAAPPGDGLAFDCCSSELSEPQFYYGNKRTQSLPSSPVGRPAFLVTSSAMTEHWQCQTTSS